MNKILLGTAIVLVASVVGAYAVTLHPVTISYRKPGVTTVDRILTPQTATVQFLAVGDIMLSRSTAAMSLRAHDPLLPFSSMSSLLEANDFNFGNLESPVSGTDVFTNSQTLVFNAPRSMIQGLVENKFTVMNLANNHALDQGKTGIDFTRKFLHDNGIMHLGTGETLDEAWQPQFITENGITIGFVGASYASANDNGVSKNNFVARMEDTARLAQAIEIAARRADFVVATMHAGTEYIRTPNQGQIDFAHAAIDAGADMVIGAHPHWVQTIEQYKNKYIFYSLGNFIFDQDWSQETKEGLTADIVLEKNLDSDATDIRRLALLPVIIEKKGIPRLASDVEGKKILGDINIEDPVLIGR